MKFIHRTVCLILILTVVCSSMVCTFCLAETTQQTLSDSTEVVLSNVDTSNVLYSDYKTAYADTDSPDSSVSVAASQYIMNSGAQIELATVFEQNQILCWNGTEGILTYLVEIEQSGLYCFELTYSPLETGDSAIQLGLKIDEKYPFQESSALSFERLWVNDGDVWKDGLGNEFAPKQVQYEGFIVSTAKDDTGFETKPYYFYMEAGQHTIQLIQPSDSIAIQFLTFAEVDEPEDYSEVSAAYKVENYNNYQGNEIILQGEDANIKSSKSLIGLSDNSDPGVSPSDVQISLVNYIGSTNWETPGETLTWNLDVTTSGLYKLGIKYRQNQVINSNSYRQLYVDGKVICKQAESLSFSYGRGWNFYNWCTDDGEDILIYLPEGKHTLKLEVTLGDTASIVKRLHEQIGKIGTLYRKIVMITGETVDTTRDYNLFEQIPNFNESLVSINEELESIITDMEKLSGYKGGTGAATIRSMCVMLEKMIEQPYIAHQYKSGYYTAYCSLSSYLYEMMQLPLDIDYISLAAPDKEFEDTSSTFLKKASFGVQKFLYSFTEDYNGVYSETSEDPLNIWVNWGRDQAQVLNNLISSDFTTQYGIDVNLKLTNATLIQAILSGNGPDCSLQLVRSEPINLAMRGGLYDLSQFEDYDNVMEQFMPKAGTPYNYQGGHYALPDTQTFFVMFYRTDILEEMGLKVPSTWSDFIDVASVLQSNNLQAGIGSTDLSMYASLLMQNGGSLYSDDLTHLNLDDDISVNVFSKWCAFYTDYKLPVTADYYNRFRTGLMPLMIQAYPMYIVLKVAAPEIDGKWEMTTIPGVEQDDGTVNIQQTSSGTGCAILNISDKKDDAWTFLKWWTSADTQYSYSDKVESILGVAGRVATSNVEALCRMSWDGDSCEAIMKQWENVNDLPEIPGGYYISRVIQQAYWNVVSNGQSAQDMLTQWGSVAELEIIRKRSQYNLD